MKTISSRYITTGRPKSTHFKAVQIATETYRVNTKTGRLYNQSGEEVGESKYEPRITIHLEGKKYNARISKVVAYKRFGPEALRKGVQVRHKNNDKNDNRGSNLFLAYNRAAAKAYRRLVAA